MLSRIITITILLCSSVTCGDGLLDLNETQMRVIAKEVRNTVNSGASQCKETARKTVHADLHLSQNQLNDLTALKCLSLSTALTCRADLCTCSTDGEQDDDDNYRADCTHTEDGKTTRKTFKFDPTKVAAFESPTPVTTTPPDTTPPDTTPPNNPSACQIEGADTLRYGELVLQLATTVPIFVSNEDIAAMTCSSSARGEHRDLRCESSLCACTATFRLNVVASQASCSEL